MQVLRTTSITTLCALIIFGAVHVVHGAARININTADAAALETLTGIGPVKAAAIIEYRGTNGRFTQIEDITDVIGIGPATFANIEAHITVGDTQPPKEETDPDDEDPEAEREQPTAGSASDGTPRRGFASKTDLAIDYDIPTRAYVHQRAAFSVTPRGLEASKLMTMRYAWNFGDGTTSDRRTPTHIYTAPGTYRVVVTVSRQGHEAVAQANVTVLPLAVSLAWNDDGDLLLHSDAQYEIDVSGLRISDGEETFTFPEHTYLLPRSTITLSAARTGFVRSNNAYVFAYDQYGELLAEYPEPLPAENEREFAQTTMTAQAAPRVRVEAERAVQVQDVQKKTVSEQPPEKEEATTTALDTPDEQTQLAATAVAGNDKNGLPSSPRDAVPYAFVGMLLVGVLALYAHKLV